jgi:radical SAM protein with 4Fe4S-binding SPASM domain
MYPYLTTKVVIVKGPAASGVYDLNRGSFQRVNHEAGKLLSVLDGVNHWRSFNEPVREFLRECLAVGIVSEQAEPIVRRPTELNDVLRTLRPVKFAWIEITSRCNQRCKHCFLGSDLNAYPPYSKEEVFGFFSVLEAAGCRQVILSGGEPLAHPEFLAILEHVGKNYRFRLSLLTNGSHPKLMTVIPELIEYEVTVKIPLLGWGVTHDKMAGLDGGFLRTMQTISSLKEAGVNVQLGTTVTALNYMDISKIRDFANAQGLKLEVSPLYSVGYAEANHDVLYEKVTQQQLVSICVEDKQRIHAPIEQAPPRSMTRFNADPTDYDAVDLKDYLTEHSECGQKIIAILSSRHVTPCLLLRGPEMSLGSLERNSLLSILDRSAHSTRHLDDALRLENIPGCSECEARFVCKGGGCPASSYAFAGSISKKNPLFTDCYYPSGSFSNPLALTTVAN